MCWFVSQLFKAVSGIMQEELVQSAAVTRDDSKLPSPLSSTSGCSVTVLSLPVLVCRLTLSFSANPDDHALPQRPEGWSHRD